LKQAGSEQYRRETHRQTKCALVCSHSSPQSQRGVQSKRLDTSPFAKTATSYKKLLLSVKKKGILSV
jgi:hypothetical protein